MPWWLMLLYIVISGHVSCTNVLTCASPERLVTYSGICMTAEKALYMQHLDNLYQCLRMIVQEMSWLAKLP